MTAPAIERWTGLPWGCVVAGPEARARLDRLGPAWRAVVAAGPPVKPVGGWSQRWIHSVPHSIVHGGAWVQRVSR